MSLYPPRDDVHEVTRLFWGVVEVSYDGNELGAVQRESRKAFMKQKVATAHRMCPNCLRDDGKHDRVCPLRPYDWATDFEQMSWDSDDDDPAYA